MLNLTIRDILTFLNINFENISSDFLCLKVENISVNSKAIRKNTLFIPLKGERVDGHKYIKEALKNGAVAALARESYATEEDEYLKNKPIIKVKDTFEALRVIGKNARLRFTGNVIGVTGSCGKTTTKEYIYTVLSSKFATFKNDGNKNGQIGVPITLFGLNNSFKTAIIEMGISKPGEMEILANLVNPNIAVITNIGYSHVEYFRSLENIFKEKFKIAKNFNKNSLLILNGNNSYLNTIKNMNLPFKVLTFGIENKNNDVKAYNIKVNKSTTEFDVIFKDTEYKSLTIPAIGKHNVIDALAAVLLGIYFKIDEKLIRNSLLTYSPLVGRQQIKKVFVQNSSNFKTEVTIIDDCYNANPSSMVAAIDTLKILGKGKRKIAILADMLEQGEESQNLHKNLGKYVAESGVDVLLAIGPFSEFMYELAKKLNKDLDAYYFKETSEEVCEVLKNIIKARDILLFKGSLGMGLRSVLEKFTNV